MIRVDAAKGIALLLLPLLMVITACGVIGGGSESTPTPLPLQTQTPVQALRPISEATAVETEVVAAEREIKATATTTLPPDAAEEGEQPASPTTPPESTAELPASATSLPSAAPEVENIATATSTLPAAPTTASTSIAQAATITPNSPPSLTPVATKTAAPPSLTPVSTNTPATAAAGTSEPTATKQMTSTPTATAVPTINSYHYADCANRTGSNATVGIPADTTISGGLTLAAGDEIAIFTPDGTICSGVSAWTGQNIAVTAWGDDTQTTDIDGLRTGETMQFRIWDASSNVEYLVTNITFSLGSGVYTANGIQAISAITVTNQ